MDLICHHERRIETKSEMTDHVVFCRLVFVFLKKLCRTGECDLRDILFHLFGRHTKSVVGELQRLLFRIHFYLDRRFVIIRQLIFSHHIQFL